MQRFNNPTLLRSMEIVAERLDPVLVHEFLSTSIEVSYAHYQLVKPTLTELQCIRTERMLNNASMLLYLFGNLHSG